MGILAWIIFGALAGGVAGMIAGSKRSGCLYNIIIGVVGAFVGGLIMQFITGETFNKGGRTDRGEEGGSRRSRGAGQGGAWTDAATVAVAVASATR